MEEEEEDEEEEGGEAQGSAYCNAAEPLPLASSSFIIHTIAYI